MSQVELHLIKQRMASGRLAKAGRGELAVPLPAGYARRPSGEVALDRKRMGMPVLPVNRFIRVKLLQEEGFTSYFAAPLRNKGQVIGVLELFTRKRIDPDE